jgi:hypothetical protein
VALIRISLALLAACPSLLAIALPPVVCPAGAPIGAVDLRVSSTAQNSEPLPLRTLNRLEEGDTLLYRPLLRSGEQRKGEVALVLVPANPKAAGQKLVILDPHPANKPQQWKVPMRTAVVAYIYGPSGLSTRKVRSFLQRDDELIAQLADYAEKTAQTEALISALASPESSAAAVQSALHGFSSQYGLNVQLDKTAPSEQQAMALFRALNPQMANYDPITPQRTRQIGQTASLATSVATLFFGSPVGLAAGGTAMLLEIRSLAFPSAEFRSSFAQPLPDDAVGLCGRRDAVGPHTKVAYLWALRIPNIGPPQITVDKKNSLPPAGKSSLPVETNEVGWKYVDRARNWSLIPEAGKPIPVKVTKLGDTRNIELDLPPTLKTGRYSLAANWDWDKLNVGGEIHIRPLSDFAGAHFNTPSKDLLVAKTGKVPVVLEGSDFEFVTKVEVLKVDDKFATSAAVPFIMSGGLREGPQDRLDLQLNTVDMDPGTYRLLISQVDGKAHPVSFQILTAPPQIENFPVVLNEGVTGAAFTLKGHRLDLISRLEVARGTLELGAASDRRDERKLTIRMSDDVAAGTSLAVKAFLKDRSEPLTFADAVRIAGPRPAIKGLTVSAAPDQDIALQPGELAGGGFLSAMLRVDHMQSNSVVDLNCDQPGSSTLTLHLGERNGGLSLQQLAPDQIFLSFDTSLWPNGCPLQATIANGDEGRSHPYPLGRIVRVPKIEKFELTSDETVKDSFVGSLTGQNLETIERAGWSQDQTQSIADLPLPVPGEGQRQRLQVRLPPPPSPHALLYLWLRSESKARLSKLHS